MEGFYNSRSRQSKRQPTSTTVSLPRQVSACSCDLNSNFAADRLCRSIKRQNGGWLIYSLCIPLVSVVACSTTVFLRQGRYLFHTVSVPKRSVLSTTKQMSAMLVTYRHEVDSPRHFPTAFSSQKPTSHPQHYSSCFAFLNVIIRENERRVLVRSKLAFVTG